MNQFEHALTHLAKQRKSLSDKEPKMWRNFELASIVSILRAQIL